MEGNSNAAVLMDNQPKTRRAKRTWSQMPLEIGYLGQDFAWEKGFGGASQATSIPLWAPGLARFGSGIGGRFSTEGFLANRGKSNPAADQTSTLAKEKPCVEMQSECADAGLGGVIETSPSSASALEKPTLEPQPVMEQEAVAHADPMQQLAILSARIKAGDQSAMVEIQRIFNNDDTLWRELGGVEKTTEAMLIEIIGGTEAAKEAVRRSVRELKQSLLCEKPTALERITVGRVVACWLFAHFVDRWCSWSIKEGARASDLAKLLESAEKRYGAALKSLKLVRGMRLLMEG